MLVIVASSLPVKLATVLLVALALTGCGSDAPTPEGATREANSGAVRQASASVASQLNKILTGVAERTPGMRPVAASTSDSCLAGDTHGVFPHDSYRLQCSWGETRYFAVRGDLPDVRRQLDAAAKQTGLTAVNGESLQDVEANLAAGGTTDNGQLLSPPTWTYVAPGYDGPLHVSWSQATDSRARQYPVEPRWPLVFQDDHPVDLDSLWNGPLRGQKYLISITSSVTYHEVAWPS
ncbi:hypothetical protein ACGFIR_09305 [Micromonospora sp. NPDC049051]|uniref:hypothetical protein n=1 Tax=Micromonospora sp. NPDC049051 TaxID=3364264 RepID=UPI0037106C1E